MTGVTSVDLHALDVLARAQFHAANNGASLVVRSPSRRVVDMLLLTGVDALISIELD